MKRRRLPHFRIRANLPGNGSTGIVELGVLEPSGVGLIGTVSVAVPAGSFLILEPIEDQCGTNVPKGPNGPKAAVGAGATR
jgi:hypothetical protein